jgi:hypothetical protein
VKELPYNIFILHTYTTFQTVETEGGPILFTSPNPKADASALQKRLDDPSIRLLRHRNRGEIVPERVELRKEKKTICIIIQEIACHSYTPFPTNDGRIIFLGSLEFLITLYLSLSIFTLHGEDILGPRILCQVKELIKISRENIVAKKSHIPSFALQCRGHQTRFSSLLREKVKRQEKRKQRVSRKRTVSKARTRKSPRRNQATEQDEK